MPSRMRWRWQRNYSAFMSENFRTLYYVSSGTVGTFLNELTGLLTLWVGAFLVISGDLTIGQLIAFRIISGYVVSPLLRLATSWQSFHIALAIERLSDVVDAQVKVRMMLLIFCLCLLSLVMWLLRMLIFALTSPRHWLLKMSTLRFPLELL